MADFLDAIESGFNSLLEPLTSGLGGTPTTASVVISSSITPTLVQSSASVPSTNSASVVRTSSTAASKTSSAKSSAPTSKTASTASTLTSTETTLDDIASTTSSSSITTATTLTTSRLSSTPSPTSSSSQSTSSLFTPPAPAASPTAVANSESSVKPSSPSISTAGIVVAVVFAVALLASILYLTIRFCPGIRNRIDAVYQRRREERSYREAIDGPIPPEKDDTYSSSSSTRSRGDSSSDSVLATEKQRVSMAAAKKLELPVRPASSFFALGRNPQLQSGCGPLPHNGSLQKDNRFSWEVRGHNVYLDQTAYQQYVSPRSAGPHESTGQGLGLGRVSVLRNHSLLRKAGYDVPPKLPGLSMTTAQAEIAVAGAVRITPARQEVAVRQVKPTSPVRMLEPALPTLPQQIRRKPVAAQVSNNAFTGSVESDWNRQWPLAHHADIGRLPTQPTVDRIDDSFPSLCINTPSTPGQRLSQIGMAVSSTPPCRPR